MPNHITNKVKIVASKEEVKLIIEKISNDTPPEAGDFYISFDKIISPPDGVNLNIVSDGIVSSIGERNQFRAKLSWEELCQKIRDAYIKDPDCLDEYMQAIKNKIITGYACWYDWNSENWGTKWNAYSQVNKFDGSLDFQTAWCHPELIFNKLSTMFPDATFQIEHASEDWGSNTGKYEIKNGIRKQLSLDGISKEQFACELWGQNYKEYLKEMEEYEDDSIHTTEGRCPACTRVLCRCTNRIDKTEGQANEKS